MESKAARSQAALLPQKLAFGSVISVSQSKAKPITSVSWVLAGTGIKLDAWNGRFCQLKIICSRGIKKRRKNLVACGPEIVLVVSFNLMEDWKRRRMGKRFTER